MGRDLLDWGERWLTDRRQRHAATEVTYQRGSDQWKVLATRGRSEFEGIGADGQMTLYRATDFLIAVEALAVEPAEGDLIIDGESEYRVIRLGDEPEARPSDPADTTWRIHTKRFK